MILKEHVINIFKHLCKEATRNKHFTQSYNSGMYINGVSGLMLKGQEVTINIIKITDNNYMSHALIHSFGGSSGTARQRDPDRFQIQFVWEQDSETLDFTESEYNELYNFYAAEHERVRLYWENNRRFAVLDMIKEINGPEPEKEKFLL